MTERERIVALILAAGASTRFGGPKLLASLAGRPVLQHVVDLAAQLRLDGTVVVLGAEAAAIEAAVDWRQACVVRNPHPEAGLSSSVRVGLDAVRETFPDAEAVLILLGDQPLARTGVIDRLLAAEVTPGRTVVVPRYAGGGGPNPALVHAAAWTLAEHASGDRGLGPVLAAHPELVQEVPVEGDNPDVDTAKDLAVVTQRREADALLDAWAARVRGNREQVDRVREVPDGPDFYGPVSSMFIADPRRTDDPQLDELLGIARPEETWLDIGAGAGRFALPLALHVREVIAVDPSDGMLQALREAMIEQGIGNIRILHGRWPLAPDEVPADGPPAADVALIAHLGYDIEAIGPFLDAMEAAARRRCVAVLMERQPSSAADPFWPVVHGETRVSLPALDEFVAVLEARGRAPSVTRTTRPPRGFTSLEELERFGRRQLWVEPGSAKDEVYRKQLAALAREHDGRWWLDDAPSAVGIVEWTPR
jgi:CTP:molybdopterin cytidylyltransferase MocA/SAM-dependent methyltransferase